MRSSHFDILQHRIYDISRHLILIGVTGTKGKTTTTSLIAHLLNQAGIPTACATTIHSTIPGVTPGPPCTIQGVMLSFLQHVQAAGVKHVVIEATSNALANGLGEFCEFAGAVFTNLGYEHLHIHGSRENYLQAKRRLFSSLGAFVGEDRALLAVPLRMGTAGRAGWAVVNGDDPVSEAMLEGIAPQVTVSRYGFRHESIKVKTSPDLRASRLQFGMEGSRFTLHLPDRTKEQIWTGLVGEFNVYNTLAAIAAGTKLGLSLGKIQQGLRSFVAPPGRFEMIRGRKDRPLVVVDYAHTPESLEQVLQTARHLAPGSQLWTVFGCGGNTDPAKRPLMGEIAARLSDQVVLTNDNPRNEDPSAIIAAILPGCREGGARIQIEPDRRLAIALAVCSARPQDVVLVAGKGHETEQILGDETFPFADGEVVRELLGAMPR